MHAQRWTPVVLTLLVVAPAAGAHSTRVSVSVVPRVSFTDQPVHVRIGGLHPRISARVLLRVSDANGRVWHSSALFRADSRGSIDLDRSAARSGGYAGRWGMGLLASLTTSTRAPFYEFKTGGTQSFRLDVRVRGR